MWRLIRRELDGMVAINVRNSIQTYSVFGFLFILFMWLLGQNVMGLLETEIITVFIILVGMLAAGSSMTFNMEEDMANRQILFLQTLPITKKDIVHAKFLSNLLLCGFIFVWVSTLVSANLLINDVWTLGSIMVMLLFVAILLFMITQNLVVYFVWGTIQSNWIVDISFVIWMTILVLLGFNKPAGISEGLLYGGTFITSLLAYLICWWVAVKKVRLKGFPKEVDSPGRKKQKNLDELKRRQSERHS